MSKRSYGPDLAASDFNNINNLQYGGVVVNKKSRVQCCGLDKDLNKKIS